jgi:serine/threonine protein kinase/Tol biopolymer transport system component
MASLREEITRSLRRFGKRGETSRPPGATDDTRLKPAIREGRQFGPYRVVEHLGSGGMGDVYVAIDTRLERRVALKFLPPEFTSDRVMLERFQVEARTASALNHPNILTIYDIGQIEGEYFIASEYIDGITLRTAMNHDAIDAARAVNIATQVASALAQAHSAGIIHRDLKPGNIMLRQDGYVKVIDFGLAKLVETPAHSSSRDFWTRPGALLGTTHYMSPEQARGLELDQRTDLWSLGVILYEMLAHKRPFEGDTDSHVIVAIIDRPIPPLPGVPALSAELQGILDRALAKDPAKRFQSASEMLGELRKIHAAAGPESSVPPLVITASRKASSKLRYAGLAVLGLLLGFALWWWGLGGRYRFTSPDWIQFESANRITYDDNVSLGTISPDGKTLAYVAGKGRAEVLHIRPIAGGAETQVSITDHHCVGLTFSPDNQSLYYVLKNPQEELGRLYRLKLPSAIPRLVLEDIDGPVTFSPDGQQFAFLRRSEEKGSNDASIFLGLTHEPLNVRRIVTKTNTMVREQLAWSPRGDRIAAIAFPAHLDKPTKPAVYLFSLDGRSVGEFSPRNLRDLSFPIWLQDGSSIVASALGEGAQERHLEQLYLPTGQFHELPSALAFDSLSATNDGSTLAAVSLDQRSSIWVADRDHLDQPRRLTPQAENIESLAWLGDGTMIFPSSRSGNMNLARLTEDGNVQQVAAPEACVERQPATAARESLVVYSSNCAAGGEDFNIWRLDLASRRRVQMTSGPNFDIQPDVSQDGQWIVYTSWPSNSPSVWKIPVNGGTPVRVYAQQARYPFLSPDGTQIVCQIREFNGTWYVAILSLATGEVLRKFPELPANASRSTPVRWSPDGSALDYVANTGGSSNTWRQPLNGGAPRQLTASGEDKIIYFSWNPNGTKLAYIRGRAESDVMLFRRASRK